MRIFWAVTIGATMMLTPAFAENQSTLLFDGGNGWTARSEYMDEFDNPTTPVKDTYLDCHLRAQLSDSAEARSFGIYVRIENDQPIETAITFLSDNYKLKRGLLGDAVIDIDGTAFKGPALGYKRVVRIVPAPKGFLKAFESGGKLTAALPGVELDTWTIDLTLNDGALDAFVECVDEKFGKDAFSLL